MPKILSEADIEAFRTRLCDVAENLFAAHGPDGVTMRQLADALSVSSMTPYRYFRDKDAILAAVRTRAFNRFAAAMEAAGAPASAPTDKSPGGAYFDFALANPAAYRMMFDVNQPTASDYPDLVEAMDRARLTMGAALRRLEEEGAISGDVDLMAHAFWSAMHGAVMLDLAGLLESPLDARAVARPALEALGSRFGIPWPWRSTRD
ncbi:MAG: TetR family transcriptional regulator [Alphaproteobacteria bacterium]|nr:TetR family transcriptional regulator [Alphaproteobacteria bacterium]